MDDKPNIDHLINWVDFYRRRLPKEPRRCGESKMNSPCPFHDDDHPSFWFNTENGMWKCEAGCGSGNATTFLARQEGISNAEAWRKLLDLAGVAPSATQRKGVGESKKGGARGGPPTPYTVEDYAKEKGLDPAFLRDMGLQDGQNCVQMPYVDENGEIKATRKRFANTGGSRFSWVRGGTPVFYGLWRLPSFRKAGYVILVEGESDCHALWTLGFPALGVPGATNFKTEWAQLLEGLKVYIHVEPDRGGENFLKQTVERLRLGGYAGKAKSWRCSDVELKDPSEVYLQRRDEAEALIRDCVKRGAAVEIEQVQVGDYPAGAPIVLEVAREWRLGEEGIHYYRSRDEGWHLATWTPLLITRILRNHSSGEEKVELAFKKNGKWRKCAVPRGTIAASREIVSLSAYGADITSENARHMVKYLSALEQANADKIPIVECVETFGWIDKKRFLPGVADDIDVDIEGQMAKWAGAFRAKGDYEAWKEAMRPLRKRSLFRFLLATAFSPPLLRILGHRIFIVHNWGDSKGGKTAALLSALSVWGDPDGLRVSFNATKNGIEQMAKFFCDLPLGIDERQLAGGKQEFIENIVYMLGSGSGRLRSNITGGLREMATWRTVVMTTGEEPLVGGQSQTGVSTRTLELFGKPFEREEAAGEMYDLVARHFGHAGPDFVRQLIGHGEQAIRAVYDKWYQLLGSIAGKRSRVHVANVAMVVTADELAGRWIFGEEDVDGEVLSMASEILMGLDNEEEYDINERAYRFAVDWVLSNQDHFKTTGIAPLFGKFILEGKRALIFTSIFEAALVGAGYSAPKTMRWLAENGKIATEIEGDTIRRTKVHRIDGRRVRMVELVLPERGQDAPSPIGSVDDLQEARQDEMPESWVHR